MVSDLFDIIGEVVGGFVSVLTDLFTAIVDIVYTPATGFTLLGTLMLIAVGTGLVYWAFGLIQGLVKSRK